MKNRYKKNTNWYVINIKARDIQTPQRYIDVFERLNEKDPLIQLRGSRHISVKSTIRVNTWNKIILPGLYI